MRDVREMGGEGIAIPTDVADPAQVEHAAQEVEQAFGPPDIWVNDAMTTVRGLDREDKMKRHRPDFLKIENSFHFFIRSLP